GGRGEEWRALAEAAAEPWADGCLALADRISMQDALDDDLGGWTGRRRRDHIVTALRRAGVPCAPVARPPERCDADADNAAWGLWPEVTHTRHGNVRVDGLPVHLSASDWSLGRGGPLVGEDNDRVFTEVLGLTHDEIADLRREGVI